METIKTFYVALSKDEAMKKRFFALNEKYAGAEPDEATVAEEIVAFAKGEGFTFEAADLIAYTKTEGKELSEEQLEAVAGGLYDPSKCNCMVGGGGKDPETGRTCVCVLGGGGKSDRQGYYLICIGAGVIDRG